MHDDDRWLTSREAAEYTGYATVTLTEAAYRGELKGVRGGTVKGRWRFKRGDLDAWMSRHSARPRRSNQTQARHAADRARAAS